jgi:hypothetical protein
VKGKTKMAESANQIPLDRVSFHIGMINAFAEMVACGVKKLAVSPPLHPDNFTRIEEASAKITAGFGIQSHLEKSLIQTDLQSASFTRGKWSILYYKSVDVLQAYMSLKKKKKELEEAGRYNRRERELISRKFMNLLSYPEEVIDAKIKGAGSDPFLLME